MPVGYHVNAGDTVEPSQHNPIFEDIQAALSARLPVNGSKGMTGPLGLADGLVGAPSLRFTTALTTGLYKVTGGFGVTVAGVLQASLTTAGLVMNNGLALLDGGDTASATALTLGAGNIFNITGTTAITSIVTKGVGTIAKLRFAGALTLTHDATNLINLTGANIVTRAGDWAQFEEYATGEWRMIGYQRADGTALIPSLPRGYIDGCVLSNGTDTTNDINITAGTCRDSTNAVDIVVSANTSGKQLDANWAVSGTTNSGMRNSAVGIANGTYHLYAARTAASSAATIYAFAGVAGTDPDSAASITTVLTALQAESGGSSYIYARRLGSIIRASAAIKAFAQFGDEFLLTTAVMDINAGSIGTTASLITITVPLGPKVRALFAAGEANGSSSLLVTSPDETDQSVGATGPFSFGNLTAGTGMGAPHWPLRTNTSGQLRVRASTTVTYYFVTRGWLDARGKDN